MGHNIFAYKIAVFWTWVGFSIAFFTFHPFYTQPSWLSYDRPVILGLVIGTFALSELMSLLSNLHLNTISYYK